MRRIAAASRTQSAAKISGAAGVLVFAAALGLATLLALQLGAADVSLLGAAGGLLRGEGELDPVLWQVRMPRVACGAAVGASLAVAGAILQTAVRNPLADPGLLGVSFAAGLGALLAVLFWPELPAAIPLIAFAGGLSAVAVLAALGASRGRSAGPLRLVLSGVALQAICFAAIAMLTFLFADRAPAFVAFLVGSLNGLGWREAGLVAAPALAGLLVAGLVMRRLDLLLLDDATASGLGVAVRRARFAASALAAWLTAAAIGVAGLVGFVGLVVPNGVRLLVGPEHRALLPSCALAGAALVLASDTAARTLVAPIELPVGALLAAIGGPAFLALLWKKLA
jgi:iron complex transport system permease protein